MPKLVATSNAMNDDSVSLPGLAPLQRVMLWDSHATAGAGHHVEQVEIILSREFNDGQVKAAWDETVARTDTKETLDSSLLFTMLITINVQCVA